MADPLWGLLATFILLSSGLCNVLCNVASRHKTFTANPLAVSSALCRGDSSRILSTESAADGQEVTSVDNQRINIGLRGATQTTVDAQTTPDAETTAVAHTQRPHGHTTQDAKALTTNTQTTPDDQTTPVAQATATSIHLTAAPWRQECKDYVDSAVRCDGPELRGFCTQEPGYAKVICARTCGFCIPCEDNIDGGGGSCADLGLLGFCTAEPMYASVICPKTCNLCGQVHGVDVLKSSTANPVSMPQASTTATIATTTTTTSPLPTGTTTATADQCRDNTAAGMSCDQLPGVCTTAFAQSLCTKYCGFC